MTAIDVIGIMAGTLTTIAFVPQVFKVWRSRSAEDVSLLMFALFSTGVLLWLLYGIALDSLPIIVANSITLALAVSVLALKVRFMWIKRRRFMAADQRGL